MEWNFCGQIFEFCPGEIIKLVCSGYFQEIGNSVTFSEFYSLSLTAAF